MEQGDEANAATERHRGVCDFPGGTVMNRLLGMVTNALGIGGNAGRATRREGRCMVFARIEESLMPLQRGQKYEDPLNRALLQAGLGRVTGGGSVQGHAGVIEWISLDIQLVDLGPALEFLRAKLLALGAPERTVLKFRKDGAVVTVQIK